MAKQTIHAICDDCVYTHVQVANLLGRSDRWAKEFIREKIPFVDIGNGLLLISGHVFRLRIEALSSLGGKLSTDDGGKVKLTPTSRNRAMSKPIMMASSTMTAFTQRPRSRESSACANTAQSKFGFKRWTAR